jgi:hypothetical protein
MTTIRPDPALDALLRDAPSPPPVPAGLGARVVAAAAATPQEVRPARARRAAARRDRRGSWLRRPLLAGTAALGLIVTSAVAATLAGVPIPQKIAAVFFPAEKAPEPKQVASPHRAPRPVQMASGASVPVEAATPAVAQAWPAGPGPWRRLFMLERVVEARRAMGLPTMGAERIERQLRRRAEIWQQATPEQRAEWIARQQARRAARQAALATPEGQAEYAARQAQMREMQQIRQQRQAGIPLSPEQRALVQEWRARRMLGPPRTPEERAARQAQVRAWQAQSQAGQPPLTDEQRAARQERFRQWREARRARWQEMNGQAAANPPAGTEGPATPNR